jgi:hypothetical protein
MAHATPSLTARDRQRRRVAFSLTPEQRLQRMEELQQLAMATLAQNPQAMEQFWHRNLRERSARTRASKST